MSQDELRLAEVFADQMVLQAGMPLRVWGRARKNSDVAVEVQGKRATGRANQAGDFVVELPELEPGGPFELLARSGDASIACRDVLVGEVWLCSGQSNMEWALRDSDGAKAAVADSADPYLRLLQVPRMPKPAPGATLNAGWVASKPETSAVFSAVGYFFGRALRRALGVPVGLIHSSVGGTPIESWMSFEALSPLSPELPTKIVEHRGKMAVYAEFLASIKHLLRDDLTFAAYKDPGNVGFEKGWAAPDFDDREWREMALPGFWEHTEIGDIDGTVWFRKSFDLGDEWQGSDLEVRFGAIDDFDDTYLNGVRVGGIGGDNLEAYRTPRIYRIPASLVRKGKNVLAVRVFDHLSMGGFAGSPDQMTLTRLGSTLPPLKLAGRWKYLVEHALAPISSSSPEHCPTALYNGMIAPLDSFGLRGEIWYQGESNTDRPGRYKQRLHAMIEDYRRRFHSKLAFLVVQLANWDAVPGGPSGVQTRSTWAELREAQAGVLELPNTGVATAIDIGDALDIHPRNKADVGERLARVALAKIYGQNVVATGPTFDSVQFETGGARVKFKDVAAGLALAPSREASTAPGKGVLAFSLAGEDRLFHAAEATIEGSDTVVLQCADEPKPVALRYAWADNPSVNLVNSEALPAFPFRTDDWPPPTV